MIVRLSSETHDREVRKDVHESVLIECSGISDTCSVGGQLIKNSQSVFQLVTTYTSKIIYSMPILDNFLFS